VDIKETIRDLRRLEPETAKEFIRGAKAAVAPMVADAKGAYPETPLSGMAREWSGKFPWQASAVRRGVKVKTSTRKNKNSVVYVTQATAAGAIFEVAGTRNPASIFARNLRQRSGRVLWPAYDRHAAQIQGDIKALVIEAEKTVQELVR
jgi:hypothetical protein